MTYSSRVKITTLQEADLCYFQALTHKLSHMVLSQADHTDVLCLGFEFESLVQVAWLELRRCGILGFWWA